MNKKILEALEFDSNASKIQKTLNKYKRNLEKEIYELIKKMNTKFNSDYIYYDLNFHHMDRVKFLHHLKLGKFSFKKLEKFRCAIMKSLNIVDVIIWDVNDGEIVNDLILLVSKRVTSNGKSWCAEIPDNYIDFSPKKFSDINFEDIGFHFGANDHMDNDYTFRKKKLALRYAHHINDWELGGKAKIVII